MQVQLNVIGYFQGDRCGLSSKFDLFGKFQFHFGGASHQARAGEGETSREVEAVRPLGREVPAEVREPERGWKTQERADQRTASL